VPRRFAPPTPFRSAHPSVVLAIVCTAQFLVVLDLLVVTVALPAIQRDLGFTDAGLAWVINAYGLVFGGFLLLGGRGADVFGRRRVFVVGVTLFAVASLCCGLATSQGMLLAVRAVQGLGGAMLTPAALSILTTTFHDGPGRRRAMTAWGAASAAAGGAGLLLGGVLTDVLSWPFIFFVNVPVGLALAVAALRWVPATVPVRRHGFDLGGAVAVTGGVLALVEAAVGAQEHGWVAPRTLVSAALAVALLGAFVVIERRHAAPLVRLSVFRVRSLAVGNAVMALEAGVITTVMFLTTLYLQDTLGYSALQTGLAFLPTAFAVFAGAMLAQRLIPRHGVRISLAGALLAIAVGVALFTRADVASAYIPDVLPTMVVAYVGLGLAGGSLNLLATTNMAPGDAGLASGLINTSQQVGSTLGLAVLSTFAASRATAADELAGLRAALWGGVLLIVLATALALALLRRRDVAALEGAGTVLEPVVQT
jgi:EmrB/QacA subfamily drug resistance transporter